MESSEKLKILFICTINRMRSATAHEIYKTDERFEVQSAGIHESARNVVSLNFLEWADTIVVMEKLHRNYIRKHFPGIYQIKKIVCLYIPDEYDYMQSELIYLLKDKLESAFARGLL